MDEKFFSECIFVTMIVFGAGLIVTGQIFIRRYEEVRSIPIKNEEEARIAANFESGRGRLMESVIIKAGNQLNNRLIGSGVILMLVGFISLAIMS